MVIGFRIGELVVVAVQAHPVDRAVLGAEGAAGGEEALQPVGHPEGAVAEQAVVADGDAQTGGDPVHHHQGTGGPGAPETGQQGHHRQEMERGHVGDRAPVVAFLGLGLRAALAGLVQGLGANQGRGPVADGGGTAGVLGRDVADRTGEGCGGHDGPAS